MSLDTQRINTYLQSLHQHPLVEIVENTPQGIAETTLFQNK